MQNDLFDQLDLAVYPLRPVVWWQSPVVQLLCVLMLVAVVVGVIVVVKKRARNNAADPVQALCDMLYHAVGEWQRQRISSEEILVLIAAIIKRYVHNITRDDAVGGMTEHEWLVYVQQVRCFDLAKQEFVQLGEILSYHKFCGGGVSDSQMRVAFELAYQIIAKTSNGKLSLTSGFFETASKSIQT